MKSRYFLAKAGFGFLAIFLLLSGSLEAQQNSSGRQPGNGKVKWFVELCSEDPQYIEVRIDTTQIPSDYEVEEVSIYVDFYNAKGIFLEKKRFWFTDEKVEALSQGKHRRLIPHSIASASQAKGVKLFYAVGPKGRRPGQIKKYEESEIDSALKNWKDGIHTF